MRFAIASVGGTVLTAIALSLSGCSDNADNNAPPANSAPANSGTATDANSTTDGAAANSTAASSSPPAADNAADHGDTPAAAFDRYKTAMKSKDYKTAFSQMTPNSQEVLLGAVAMTLNTIAAVDQSKEPDIRKIRDTYGLKGVDISTLGSNTDQNAMFKQLTADVKDKPACLAEILTWMQNNASDKDRVLQAAFGNLAEGELVDVKIDGDNATAAVQLKPGGAEKSEPVKFNKGAGQWQLDVSQMLPATPPALN